MTSKTAKAKTDAKPEGVETVEIPVQPIPLTPGGAAPADVDEGREEAKRQVREAIANKD